MQTEEMRLDGNAAAGMLGELFAGDITAARATCAGCGGSAPIATLLEYGHAMGMVLRCPSCSRVMLRLVRTPSSLNFEASGVALLTVAFDSTAASP
jgi:hypothetical protein